MAKNPRVSVAMPVLNRERFLPEAIDSVLGQTLGDWELVASDGGSTDGTWDLLNRYAEADSRIRIFSDPGTTTAECRNAILPRLNGDYVAMLDSDDVALPERLERQVAFLDRRTDLAGTGCHPAFIDADGRPVKTDKYPMRLVEPEELRRRQLAGWSCFVHSSMLVRRSAVLAVGGYRAIFRHAEDDDFFLRLLDRHSLANMPEELIRYRWHDANTCAPSVTLHVYRAAAVASAHLRLNGLADAASSRRDPLDVRFLLSLFDALGPASAPARLFWIAMLQHYHPLEKEKLEEAWRGVLRLPASTEYEDDMRRHWSKCRESFPGVAGRLAALAEKRMLGGYTEAREDFGLHSS